MKLLTIRIGLCKGVLIYTGQMSNGIGENLQLRVNEPISTFLVLFVCNINTNFYYYLSAIELYCKHI